jgi:bifunctional non-homologous end joining protein LigD
VAYIVFDLLYLDGHSLLSAPYEERRATLAGLQLDGPHWQTPPHSVGGGREMLALSREQGLEGVIAKRLGAPYEPGKRSGAWLKIKNQQRQEFVIGGWVPGAGSRAGKVGALVIGYREGNELVSAGKVGTGFTAAMLRDLEERLRPLARATSPFTSGVVPREAHHVEPRLVCEVEFSEWTSASRQLRHPSFKGLRPDKSPDEVFRETSA